MKIFKSVLSVVLMLCMIVPMAALGSFAEEASLEDNWTCLGAKFSGSTNNIIIDKTTNKVRDDGFEFTVNENGGIEVHVPDYTTFAGGCPTVVLASTHATPLEGLEVKVTLAEDTAYKADGKGFYGNFSMLWSEEQITAIYDPETQIGEDSSAYAITNGMRNIGTPEKKGIYIIVGGGNPDNNGTKIASYVNVYLFDGEFRDAIDDVPGYRWTFAARNKPEVGGAGQNGDDSGIIRGHEFIDLSDGLTYYFRADTTLGYVTVINGTEYYRGKGSMPFVGYFPSNVKFSNDDRKAMNDTYKKTMEYKKDDIDLSFLTTVEKGYVSVMALGNLISSKKNPDCYLDFTLDTVNGVPAAEWDAHVHTWSEWETVKEPTCVDGERKHHCTECGEEETEVIPATMEHDWTEWEVTKEPSCAAGERYHKCSRCQTEETETIAPIAEHTWGEWEVTTEPSLTVSGVESRECPVCHTVETNELGKIYNRFTDVPNNKWFALPAVYCYTKGYMTGMTETTFAPNDNLTRAMFVQILAKIANADLSGYTKDLEGLPFTDVKAAWYIKALKWAYENKYTSGLTETTFGPNNNVTRQELATFLYTYATKNEIVGKEPADLSGYPDYTSVAKWAKNAMSWAVGNELISGVKVGDVAYLQPKGNATRGQVATIVKNFVQKVIGDLEVDYVLVIEE